MQGIFLVTLTCMFANAQYMDYNDVREEDPKEIFFRNLKFKNNFVGKNIYEIAKPMRQRRSTENETDLNEGLKIAKQIESDISKRLGKATELIILEPENVTRENTTTSNIELEEPKSINYTDAGNDVLVLNDFIRFKREDSGNPEEQNGKMLLEPSDPDTNREPRGAMKEQWLKQPYPVQTSNFEDTTSRESIRAPRVHFVTHRLTESAQSPSVYHSYDRLSRNRDFSRDSPDSSQDYVNMRTGFYNEPQYYSRKYDNNYYPDEYRNQRNHPRYEQYDKYYTSPDRDHYSYNRQRRIIYYATLPEVVRNSPSERDRIPYRNRFDDYRYTSLPSEAYHFRKPSYMSTKSRYDDEIERPKVPYPLKVSTDVNVSEIKKNPERRIYSETDRRYAFKAPPYQAEDTYSRHI